jgi:hypothetical protein
MLRGLLGVYERPAYSSNSREYCQHDCNGNKFSMRQISSPPVL